MTALTASFRKPFAEQVAAFRLRLGNLTPTVKWDDIQRAQHDRAFMVAGAQKADLLAVLAAAVDKAVSQGTTLDEFRRDFREIVERRGWHGWTGEGTKGGEAWRTKVIYKTNMATTYAAGRMAQLVVAHEAADPLHIRLFRADAVVVVADLAAHFVEQAGRARRTLQRHCLVRWNGDEGCDGAGILHLLDGLRV